MFSFTTKHKYLDNFILGVLAGIAIGLGGFLNLIMLSFSSEPLKYLGGVLFSIGLLTVCTFSLHLYTGKVGYLFDNKKNKYPLSLFIMYLGNVVGAVGFGYLLWLTKISSEGGLLYPVTNNVALGKVIPFGSMANTWIMMLRILVMSFFCGIMVFLAVDIFKKAKSLLFKIGGLVVCVALFVITGMEHCVADMFYFAIGNTFVTSVGGSILTIIIATIGNSLGGIASRLVVKHIENK